MMNEREREEDGITVSGGKKSPITFLIGCTVSLLYNSFFSRKVS